MTGNDLFVSDLHLRADRADHRAALGRFLQREARRAARLFILGDLFHVWIGRKHLAEPFVAEVVEGLRQLTASGVDVHFIAGNRDFYGLKHLAARTGMTAHRKGFSVESQGRSVWVCHGHELYVHDRRTHMAQAVTHSRPVEWLFQTLPRPLAMFLAHGYQTHSGRVVAQKTPRMLSIDDEGVLRLFAAGHEAIVCGHTHRLAHVVYRWDGRRGHLYNLGSWDEGPHFLRHAPDGWHFHRLST